MSIESDQRNSNNKISHSILKGAAIGATALAGGVVGAESGARHMLDEINKHVLTPAVIRELKSETNATDADIANLEANLKTLIIQELKRTRN